MWMSRRSSKTGDEQRQSPKDGDTQRGLPKDGDFNTSGRSLQSQPSDPNDVFQTGRLRVSSLVNKSGFGERVTGTEETDKEILKLEGYLFKESRKGKNQKRFFTVNNSFLNYYKSRSAFRQGKLRGSIDLVAATTICILVRNGRPSRRFAIQTEAEEDNEELCLFLKAKTKHAARMWVECLNQRRTFWVGPNAPKKTLPTPALMFESSPRQSRVSDTEDEDGWRDRIASDDEEDTDEGFQDARSRDGSDDDDDNDTPRRKVIGLQNHSYSSSSEEEDSDDESVSGATRKARSSSAFQLHSDTLPDGSKLLMLPHHPWSTRFWRRPDFRDVMVRGPSYLTNRQKMHVEIEPLFECIAVDMLQTASKVDHICAHPRNRVFQAIQRKEKLPFLFVIQFQVPGPPFYSMVVYLAASHPEIAALLDPANPGKTKLSEAFPPGMKQLLLNFFKTGSDEFCHTHFKLIPRIVEGPWVVRAGIVSKPALIGTKLKNSYFRSDHYFELDINIGTNALVTTLTQLATSYAKLLTVDLAFLIEGKMVETLPEFLCGIVRCQKIDFKFAMPL